MKASQPFFAKFQKRLSSGQTERSFRSGWRLLFNTTEWKTQENDDWQFVLNDGKRIHSQQRPGWSEAIVAKLPSSVIFGENNPKVE